ncbi:FAD-dependent monooxygenase [Modestobacter marinus]|uniref:FAD-dependent monooxygenase n=1 Tax=Modestobacter marinus TaxID=477641 RepID=UPI001C93DCFD|nr:FAD-dependent monooxygenase [Modestobacter marinus]
MRRRPLRVLVSGAGIAGATVAGLLGRAGHQVVVVERDQGVRSSGSPVDVREPAYDVVEGLGLLPRLRDVATDVREVAFVDAVGHRVAALGTRRSRDRELEVDRTDLSAALVDVARPVAEFRFGEAVAGIRPDARGAEVIFERSAAERFDLVVGSDGVHSRVRRLVFGPEAGYVRQLGMYVATVRLSGVAQRGDPVLMHNVPDAAVAVHPAGGRPGVAFLFRSARRIDPRDAVASRALLAEVYGSLRWRVPELLAAYLAAADTYFDAVCRVRTPTWSHGPVTLLGDAASCVSLFGDGSTAAIVGAWTLAESLDGHDSLPAALADYERRHRGFAARGQRAVPVVSHLLVPSTRIGVGVRNAALRVVGRRSTTR